MASESLSPWIQDSEFWILNPGTSPSSRELKNYNLHRKSNAVWKDLWVSSYKCDPSGMMWAFRIPLITSSDSESDESESYATKNRGNGWCNTALDTPIYHTGCVWKWHDVYVSFSWILQKKKTRLSEFNSIEITVALCRSSELKHIRNVQNVLKKFWIFPSRHICLTDMNRQVFRGYSWRVPKK